MPVSGLVITLDAPASESSIRALLAREWTIEFGVVNGCQLPAVLESETLKAGEDAWERIAALPGVVGVKLVFLDFEDAGLKPIDADEPDAPDASEQTLH